LYTDLKSKINTYSIYRKCAWVGRRL